jgi:hypothetical protein
MKVRTYFSCEFVHSIVYPTTFHARSRLFMTMLTGKSCWVLVAQTLSCCCFIGALSLSLPSGVSRSEDILRARCRSCSSSDRFCNPLLFLIFCLNYVPQLETQFVIKFNF